MGLPMEVRKEMDLALAEAVDEAWEDIGANFAAAQISADPDKPFKFRVGGRWTLTPQGGAIVVSCRVTTGRKSNHDSAERVAKMGGPA